MCGAGKEKTIRKDFPPIGQGIAMPDGFAAKPLGPDEIQQAFGFVSIFDRDLSLDAWCEYAAAIVEKPGNGLQRGIMTVQGAQGYIYGLSAHHLKNELHRGRVLEIENFAIADLVGAKIAVAELLLESLESIALAQQCRCMSLKLLSPTMRRSLRRSDERRADIFESAGFRGEPLRLRKCFQEGE